MKIFITGEPGVGKSTLLNQLIKTNEHRTIMGCVVDAVKKDEKRSGFKIRYIPSNKETVLASKEEHLSDYYISKYSVNVEGIEKELIPYMEKMTNAPNIDLIIFDEIGRMQNATPLFLKQLDQLLKKETIIISTLVLYDEEWARKYKTSDFQIKITKENRCESLKIIQYLIDHFNDFKKLSDDDKKNAIKKFNTLFENGKYTDLLTFF
ncbi:MAG: hypothetical protein HEEMFOPI_00409 [Holosporales bacterium]